GGVRVRGGARPARAHRQVRRHGRARRDRLHRGGRPARNVDHRHLGRRGGHRSLGPDRALLAGIGVFVAAMACLWAFWAAAPAPVVPVLAVLTVWGGAAFWTPRRSKPASTSWPVRWRRRRSRSTRPAPASASPREARWAGSP